MNKKGVNWIGGLLVVIIVIVLSGLINYGLSDLFSTDYTKSNNFCIDKGYDYVKLGGVYSNHYKEVTCRAYSNGKSTEKTFKVKKTWLSLEEIKGEGQ